MIGGRYSSHKQQGENTYNCLFHLFIERQRSGDSPLVASTQERLVRLFMVYGTLRRP